MSIICEKCGLNKELCVCETIAKEDQRITIKTAKRRFGKLTTLVEGIDPKEINIKDVAKNLKSVLACGGTVKNNIIELQGNHIEKVKRELIKLGFNKNNIKV
ncbi:MAG: translation initiation factor [archaeon]